MTIRKKITINFNEQLAYIEVKQLLHAAIVLTTHILKVIEHIYLPVCAFQHLNHMTFRNTVK